MNPVPDPSRPEIVTIAFSIAGGGGVGSAVADVDGEGIEVGALATAGEIAGGLASVSETSFAGSPVRPIDSFR